MFLRKAIRTGVKRKALVLATLILAVTATAALAAKISGDGTLIGTPGGDTITAGNGNDTVWGLQGGDTITVGKGNDEIDGDGRCMQGNMNGEYCSHGENSDDGGDTITVTGGQGDDVIYGEGGGDTINTSAQGMGNDTIYGGSGGDTIIATNPGNDTIYPGPGADTVKTGSGTNVVYAQDGQADTITCKGGHTTVYADRNIDTVNGCSTVIRATATAATRKRARANPLR